MLSWFMAPWEIAVKIHAVDYSYELTALLIYIVCLVHLLVPASQNHRLPLS